MAVSWNSKLSTLENVWRNLDGEAIMAMHEYVCTCTMYDQAIGYSALNPCLREPRTAMQKVQFDQIQYVQQGYAEGVGGFAGKILHKTSCCFKALSNTLPEVDLEPELLIAQIKVTVEIQIITCMNIK